MNTRMLATVLTGMLGMACTQAMPGGGTTTSSGPSSPASSSGAANAGSSASSTAGSTTGSTSTGTSESPGSSSRPGPPGCGAGPACTEGFSCTNSACTAAACAESPVRILEDLEHTNTPQVLWTGSELAVAWGAVRVEGFVSRYHGVRFALFGPDGAQHGAAADISPDGAGEATVEPASAAYRMGYDGERFLFVWLAAAGLRLRAGSPAEGFGPVQTLASDLDFPNPHALVWTGSAYVLVVSEPGSDDLYSYRLAADGTVLTAAQRLNPDSAHLREVRDAAFVDGFAKLIVRTEWVQQGRQTLDEFIVADSGALRTRNTLAELQGTNENLGRAYLATDGTTTAVVWKEEASTGSTTRQTLKFRGPAGTITLHSADYDFGYGDTPVGLVWTGSRYLFANIVQGSGLSQRLELTAIDAAGQPGATTLAIAASGFPAHDLSMDAFAVAWTGRGLGVVGHRAVGAAGMREYDAFFGVHCVQ